MIFTTSNPEPDPSPNFYIVFWQSSRLLPFSRSSAPSLIDSVLPPSISGFEDCIVLSFLGRKDTKRILEFFSCNLNRRKRWNEAKLDGKPFNSLNLSLNISNSFSKFVSVNFRWRGDRKKVDGERLFHRSGNGVCVQSLSYLAELPSIRDCHPGYEQL